MFEEFGRLDVDYIKTTIQGLLNNSDECVRQRVSDFLKVITFEKEAEQYIRTHDDYRVFALDNADIIQIFKDGAKLGFQKGIKAKIKATAAPIKPRIDMTCCDGEQDKPNVFQQFCKKELPEDIQRRVERAAEYGESNAEYFFRAGFFLAHELEEAKKNQDGGKR